MEEDGMRVVSLPKPGRKGGISLEEAISKRRSIRSYSDEDITAEDLSQLLWAAQGITDAEGLRSVPSAGALYPLEVYVIKKDGFFRYGPQGHSLIPVLTGDLRQRLSDASWGQHFIAQAPVSIIICAVYKRVTSRYGNRGVRYTDIEVGHAAQNIHLEAVGLGLNSVPIGAFNDDAVSSLLGLPDEETPVYIIPVGHRR